MLCAQHALNSLLRAWSALTYSAVSLTPFNPNTCRRPICQSRHPTIFFALDAQGFLRQFTAPDLSTIAHSLDNLEDDYDEDHRAQESMNMDDTGLHSLVVHALPFTQIQCAPHSGFFSIQVLEKALQVWGLKYVSVLASTTFIFPNTSQMTAS